MRTSLARLPCPCGSADGRDNLSVNVHFSAEQVIASGTAKAKLDQLIPLSNGFP